LRCLDALVSRAHRKVVRPAQLSDQNLAIRGLFNVRLERFRQEECDGLQVFPLLDAADVIRAASTAG
jgi:hypothetical protein